jgi:hypothetical protein
MAPNIFRLAGLAAQVIENQNNAPLPPLPAPSREIPSEFLDRLKFFETNLTKALLINEALWEILRDKLRLTEQDLFNKLYEVDMRDGTLDGKNQRSSPSKCPQCGRTVSARHAACIYCGTVIDQSVFRMTQ